MNISSKSSGFTLIELLVVIAIIGVLSAVVIASLGVARTRAADTAVKADAKSLLLEAQNYLDSNASLGASVATCSAPGTFFASVKATEITTHMLVNAGATPNLACATDSTGTKLAVSVTLKSGSSFCADNSLGNFTTGMTAQTSGVNQGTCQ